MHGASDNKESACNVGDRSLIPGSGRSPGEGNGKPLQYSCLENPMDRGSWRAIVHGVAKMNTFTFTETMYIYVSKTQSYDTEGKTRVWKMKAACKTS